MTRDVDPRPEEMHSFTTQPRAMPGERREPVRAYDPMTRHGWVVARPHDVADGPRRQRAASDDTHEAIRRDAARRYPFYDAVYGPAPLVR